MLRKLSDHTGDPGRLGVRLSQTGDRLVGIQPAWIGHYPDPRASRQLSLLALLGFRSREGQAVRGDAGDRDNRWVMLRNKVFEPRTPCPQLVGCQLAGPGRGTIHQVRDTDATLDQIGTVLLRHRLAAIKITIDDAGQPQRRIETIARVREVGLGGRRPQSRG